ncbi:terminase small subunit [Methylorubrum extorquens]|uniref:Terminase small subunit n=1 Tax=Methylorubrum extorquens DSM 13060 TaxID=882800 RepID=H1KC79_METEX|nr:terminase small subunit [Methylorubrum extorquens]EHP94896.1 Terminase small subunit [Methylorubrum extorquens DSM 13060]
MALTDKQARFVDEYLVDLNVTQAAIRAGYSKASAHSVGHETLKNPEVAAVIAEAKKARSERTQITQDDVLRFWRSVGTADPNEVVQYRRGCCRYCYGNDHLYQFTAAELARAQAIISDGKPYKGDREHIVSLDNHGGLGFDAKRDPNPDCPECFGEGVGRMHALDSRKLTGAAKVLYRGAKYTKDGLEIQMEDRAKAWENVAKHLGMFTEKVEMSGSMSLNVTPDDAEL